jgi:type I restriction enzyme S subunit
MSVEFPNTKIGDLASSISDTHEFGKEQLIFLNTSDILHGKLLHRTYSAVKNWPGQAKKSIRKDDILFSEIRPANGRWAYVEEDANDFVVSTKLMVIRAKQEKLFPKFLYQFLTSSEITRWLQHLAESRSGTFPQITFDQVASLELPLPPLAEQKAIASVSGAIDDKIDLNRRMSETLEALAQSLFKSWFADTTQSALPKGWRKGSILEVAKLLSGGTPKTEREDYWNGDILWASAKDVSQCGQTFLVNTERTITTKGLEESATQLIPAFCTVVVARGATTGRMTMFGREMAMNQTCYALASTTGTPFALYCLFRHAIDALVQTAHGSVFDTITTSTFTASKVVLPPQQVFEAFEKTVSPLFARILSNIEESRTLAALRDALLPKLLSGELRVPAAVKLAEATV